MKRKQIQKIQKLAMHKYKGAFKALWITKITASWFGIIVCGEKSCGGQILEERHKTQDEHKENNPIYCNPVC